MAKVFGGMQEHMLTMFSDMTGGEKLFLLTENDAHMIGRFIRNSPSRFLFHYKFDRLEEETVLEYCKDHDVAEDFLKDLMAKYKQSSVFSINHLKAIVKQHKYFPNDTLDDLLGCLNVDILTKEVIFNLVKVFDTETKESVEFNPITFSKKSIDNEYYNFYVNLRLKNDNNFNGRPPRGMFMPSDQSPTEQPVENTQAGEQLAKRKLKPSYKLSRSQIMDISSDNKRIIFNVDGVTFTFETTTDDPVDDRFF
jgi:hypothetical protein